MKKLMFAVAAVAAGVALADVTSANIVGYLNSELSFRDEINDEEMDSGFTFVTPTFNKVNGTGSTIQDIQMCAESGTGDSDVQKMDIDGEYYCMYQWVNKDDCDGDTLICPESANGIWAVQEFDPETGDPLGYRMTTPEEEALVPGEMVQVFAQDDKTIGYSGQVGKDPVVYTFDFTEEGMDSGFRFVGNPFPQSITLQYFQMNEDAGTGDCDLQKMDGNGEYWAMFQWVNKDDCDGEILICPEGANGVWAVQEFDPETGDPLGYRMPTAEEAFVPAGAGYQIFAMQDYTVTVLCPYELK